MFWLQFQHTNSDQKYFEIWGAIFRVSWTKCHRIFSGLEFASGTSAAGFTLRTATVPPKLSIGETEIDFHKDGNVTKFIMSHYKSLEKYDFLGRKISMIFVFFREIQ